MFSPNDLPHINRTEQKKIVVIRARISAYHDEIASWFTAGQFSMEISSI